MQIEKDELKLARPFKFNPFWLKDEDFTKIVKRKCTLFDPQKKTAMLQFSKNLQRLKKETIAWAKKKHQKSLKTLLEIEKGISTLCGKTSR
jgi:hypothetical protein